MTKIKKTKVKKRENEPEWFVFEEIFKVNPQTATSYAPYFDKDYLRNYLRKDLKLKNYPPQEVLFIYEKGNMKLCYNIVALESLAEKIKNKTLKNPLWAIRANKDIRKRSDKLIKIGQRILDTDLKKLSDRNIYELYREYYVSHLNMHLSGWFGNLLDYNGIFNDYLSKYLEEKIKGILNLSIPETINLLTEAKELSNAQKEEIDILRILRFIITSKETKLLFLKKKAEDILSELPLINPKINRLLNAHVEKYGWLSYQFEGPGWDKKYFIEKIKELVVTKVNPDKLIKEIRNRPKKADKIRENIIKRLKIDKKHQKLFQIYADTVFLKGYRKDAMFFGCYTRDLILKEISQRQDIPIKFLRYAYFNEMEDLIVRRTIPKKLLQERFNYHIYFYQEGVGSKILVGNKARQFVKELKWRKVKIEKVTELKGMCASPGQVKGRVAIVNVVEDIKKSKKEIF